MAKTWKQKFNKKYKFPLDKSHSIKEIARLTGRSYKGLLQIAKKGRGAYYTNPKSVRPQVKKSGGAVRWGIARVYSAVMGGKASKVDAKELKKK
jgi:hypothetical protein